MGTGSLRRRLLLFLPALLLAACSSPTQTEPITPATPVKLTVSDWLPHAPVWARPQVPLTADLPTYKPQQDPERWPPGVKPPETRGGLDDLKTLATELERTGKPDVPAGVNARFAGALEESRYVYYLGAGGPPRPEDTNVYMLSRKSGDWLATPICQNANGWVWPGAPGQDVVICALVQGSGGVLSLAVYHGDREVFRIGGLEDGRIRVGEASQGSPPDLILTGKLQWMHHKLDPAVRERFTFTWQDGTYKLARHERMANADYHLARFLHLLAAGETNRAAKAMAEPPGEGLAAYLRRQAPDLRELSGQTFTTDGFHGNGTRVYLHKAGGGAPWFWFDFTPEGLIKAFAQQAEAPRR